MSSAALYRSQRWASALLMTGKTNDMAPIRGSSTALKVFMFNDKEQYLWRIYIMVSITEKKYTWRKE